MMCWGTSDMSLGCMQLRYKWHTTLLIASASVMFVTCAADVTTLGEQVLLLTTEERIKEICCEVIYHSWHLQQVIRDPRWCICTDVCVCACECCACVCLRRCKWYMSVGHIQPNVCTEFVITQKLWGAQKIQSCDNLKMVEILYSYKSYITGTERESSVWNS